MKTEIYPDYSAFLQREDQTLNGVTTEFAADNPNWEEEKGNEGCWNCSDCFRLIRCSECSDCSGCSGCFRCFRCSGCFRCSRCSGCFRCYDCSDCSGCFRCSRCFRCSDLRNARPVESPADDAANPLTNIPIIPNIHQRLLEAVTAPYHALEMTTWHTCNTTHCRGGWVVTLAGEAGRKLEEMTTTEFAAMQIYKASSPIRVSPVRFYETDAVAMADIKRCAAEEKAQSV